MSNRQQVSSGAPWESRVGYNRAVRVGNVVAVSGTTSIATDGSIVGPGDAYAQARRCIEIIENALGEAGAELRHVVRTRVYLTRIEDWDAVGRAHQEAFGDVCPASTMLEVSRLIGDQMLVEIDADAIIPDDGP